MAFVVVSLPAMGWAWTVGKFANEPLRPIILTTLRVALPTFAVVGLNPSNESDPRAVPPLQAGLTSNAELNIELHHE
jgi:hypothetical protein